jgi:Tfp pilus assembly protein PilP
MGEDRGVHRVLVGKSEGKRSLGRPRRRWEDNIKIDLQEVVEGGRGDWMEWDKKLIKFKGIKNWGF